MKKYPIHPIFFALFPILSLYVQNTGQVSFLGILRSLILVLLLVGLVWLICVRLVRGLDRSALVCSLSIVLFSSFGHMITLALLFCYTFPALNPYIPVVETTPSLIFVFGFWLILFVLVLALILRLPEVNGAATAFLNFFSAVLLMIVALNWASDRLANSTVYDLADAWHPTANPVSDCRAPALNYRPDIYYIILDGYARGDVLQTLYAFHNSSFINHLKQRNFYVAEQSTSNYMQTALSLASSMNLTYLDSIADRLPIHSGNRQVLLKLIEDSQIATELEKRGYSIRLDSTEFMPAGENIDILGYPNVFEDTLLNTTPVTLFFRLPFVENQYDWHRKEILATFDRASKVTPSGAPTFSLIHILAPHPPFVFGPNGEPRYPNRRFALFDGSQFTGMGSEQEYQQGYRDQAAFVTSKIQATIDEILTQSPMPPIIIVQADHGSGMQLDWQSAQNTNMPERASITNAYYFPDNDYRELYSQITPVNTFRVVLNHFFGECNALLADKNYYSTFQNPYVFTDVTGQAKQKLVFDP